MSRQNPLVAVLLPAYNAVQFLERAIVSSVAQSIQALEVIIVDDASSDGTAELAERWARDDARIKVIRLSSNGGPAVARNAGLDAVTADWIALLDADDAFAPRRLELMVKMAMQTGSDVLLGNFRYYNASKGTTGSAALPESAEPRRIDLEQYLAKARPYTDEADWGVLKPLMRRSFVESHGLRYATYSRHGEDFLFIAEALLAGASCAIYSRADYLYTSRDARYSRTTLNYGSMWRHAQALLRDPRIAQSPRLCELLRERVAAVRRLQCETDLRQARQHSEYGLLMRRVLSDSAFRSLLYGKLRAKLAGRSRGS